MVDDVLLNKVAIIERCLSRISEEYYGYEDELEINLTRQDSIVLNLQRACEAAISLAMHGVRVRHLGIPQDSRDGFKLLHEAGVLDDELTRRMKAMVGFRNVAVHQYEKLNLAVIRSIIKEHLDDFRVFAKVMIQAYGQIDKD
jgi:uncharacterized protein YutE (UPF0331/DUF86 family)